MKMHGCKKAVTCFSLTLYLYCCGSSVYASITAGGVTLSYLQLAPCGSRCMKATYSFSAVGIS